MEGCLISVAKWREGSQAYFLTHLHADHTQGLTATWSNGPIYCSRLTAKLVPFRFPGFDLSLLRVLDTGAWYTLPLLSLGTSVVRVMAIEANHCPGAVMFLFHGELGCRLYTGDFRWEASSARARSGRVMLLGALKDESVHMLYVDNTYCNPSYEFPPREVADQQVNLTSVSQNSGLLLRARQLVKCCPFGVTSSPSIRFLYVEGVFSLRTS